MPTLKEYNVKLARLRSTRKLTRTMKLVSVTKLRRAQEAERRAGQFAARLTAMLGRLGGLLEPDEHPLVTPRKAVGKVLVLAITSDRGLCGGFNNALLKATQSWVLDQQARGRMVTVDCCGRRAFHFFKNRGGVDRYHEGVVAKPDYLAARKIGRELTAAFLSGRVDEVYLAYNAGDGALAAKPVIERLAPLDPAAWRRDEAMPLGDRRLLEPARDELLATLLPRVACTRVYAALRSNAAGEHAARSRAMEQASANADDLIRRLLLQRNRARQARITTELTEIVAGAEALK
jgi:F-type H+-transporting ATPase subunit gamma